MAKPAQLEEQERIRTQQQQQQPEHGQGSQVRLRKPMSLPLRSSSSKCRASLTPERGGVLNEHWRIPKWMDERKVRISFEKQQQQSVHGLFVRYPLLTKYDWFWRVEPGVRFYCDITYDLFRLLALCQKLYGFVIAVVENRNMPDTDWEYSALEF
ncbi:hypothetical protein JCM1841_004353 [Sporobolomyces salmonicolor]